MLKEIVNKDITTNIYRIQAYDSIMSGYFHIRFVDFMFKGKSLTQFTNLFSPNNFKNNDKITLNYFLDWDIKMVETTKNVNAYLQWYNGMQSIYFEINRIKDDFIAEIHEKETKSKRY